MIFAFFKIISAAEVKYLLNTLEILVWSVIILLSSVKRQDG